MRVGKSRLYSTLVRAHELYIRKGMDVSEKERVEIPVTRYIEKSFVIRKMKRWLAASIVVGLMFSVAYCLYFNMKHSSFFWNAGVDDRLLVSNYNGDYLSYPETTRCAIWDIEVKEEVMNELSRNPAFIYKNYLHQYGDVLVERLNSLWSRQAVYDSIRDDSKIGTYGLSSYELNDVFGGAFLYSEQTLGINVTAPFAYQAMVDLSHEELVYIRDKVFAAYTALLDDAVYYDDLPIKLIRKDSKIEEKLSEQKLIREVMQAGVSENNSILFPKKRMLFCFALGAAFVEMIAFLLAVRDDRVKSVKELEHRTDLGAIDVTNETEMDAYCQKISYQESREREGVAYLYKGTMSAELTEKMRTYIRKKYAFNEVIVLERGIKNALPQGVHDKGCIMIIPITVMKTTYGELAEIAEEINQCSGEVQAIVLQG